MSKYHKDINKMNYDDDILDRFWTKVHNPGDWDYNKCFIWTGGLMGDYGCFSIKSEIFLVHRFIYECYYGHLSDFKQTGICVCHHCDNPLCVRI